MEDRARLSRWLYSVLEGVGATERLRRLHRETAVSWEIISTVHTSFLIGKLCNNYICGSSYEGSVTPALASDQDVISCFSFLPVVLDAAASPPGQSFLMVRDSWTYPGYVKLQALLDGRPLNVFHMPYSESFDVDNEGRICYKPMKLDNMHGPAGVRFDENGVHVLDHVPACRCDHIPQYAMEWITRPRPYGWPFREQLQTMSRMGCMVVGVGHMSSGEKEIEWRMSYTLQERMLMSSLNPTQHKVYILLKLLKKNILGNIIHEETLTSYHLKTCVMYAVQMSPTRVWTQDNLINSLMWCLKLLVKWLETNYCPSFVTQYQNLFMKKGFSRLRKGLLKEMRTIVQSGHQVLYMIQSDNVGDIFSNGDWRMYREVTTYARNDYIGTLKHHDVRLNSKHALGILRFMSNGSYDPITLTLCLENLKNARHINEHSVEVTRSAMVLLFPMLHLHIAYGLASFTHECPDRAVRERVMKLVDSHLQEVTGFDLVNKRLAIASVLYTFEKYEECSELIHMIESDFTYQVMHLCPCTERLRELCYNIRDKHERDKKKAKMPIRQFIKSMTACCVIFLPSAAAIAPDPLQYEMQRSLGTLPGSRDEDKDFWFDWAVVDAKVYMYFLQFLVNSKLNNEVHKERARYNLRAEIFRDDQVELVGRKSMLCHKDTACNLLGWMYMREGRLAHAYGCFLASWKIRPFHNAAKYHMRDLLVRLAPQ